MVRGHIFDVLLTFPSIKTWQFLHLSGFGNKASTCDVISLHHPFGVVYVCIYIQRGSLVAYSKDG